MKLRGKSGTQKACAEQDLGYCMFISLDFRGKGVASLLLERIDYSGEHDPAMHEVWFYTSRIKCLMVQQKNVLTINIMCDILLS
jgi:hypothetical protein